MSFVFSQGEVTGDGGRNQIRGMEGRARDKLGEGTYKPLRQRLLQLASPDQVRSQGRGLHFPRMKRQGHTNRLTDSGGVRQPSVG